MGFTNGEQLREVWLCAGVGFWLGVYYDVFRVWRVWMTSGAVSVFFQDVLYCLSSAMAVFVLLLVITDGQGRVYAFVGLIVGFFAERSLVGRYTVGVARRMKRFVGERYRAFQKKHAKKPKKAKKSLESQGVSGV